MLRRKTFLYLIGLLMLEASCIAPSPPKPGKQVVRVCVQPVYSLHVMSQKFSPFFNYLARETGYDVQVVSATNYDRYFSTLEANRVHIGIQNPLAYITLAKTRGAYPLAKMVQPDGSTSYRGIIIVRDNGSIHRIEDLRERTVAAASHTAVGGYLAQAFLCSKHGLRNGRDFKLSLVDTQDNVIGLVYRAKADAGFVREDSLEAVRGKIDLSKIKVIAYTDNYPTWCVAAFANTPPEVASKIGKCLLDLDRNNPQHREILESIGISGFEQASDADYDVMRKTMEELNLPY